MTVDVLMPRLVLNNVIFLRYKNKLNAECHFVAQWLVKNIAQLTSIHSNGKTDKGHKIIFI